MLETTIAHPLRQPGLCGWLAGRPLEALAVDDFARLHGVHRVFVTENYINFLAFPNVHDAIVVFGQGFDVGKLAQAPWLHDVPVHYWGDIDTYGFAYWTIFARFCRPRARC